MRLALLLVLIAVAPVAAVGADEVTTGNAVKLRRGGPPRYSHIYSAYDLSEKGAKLLAFSGAVRVGDAFDLVDQRGWLGRVLVDHIEARGCGEAKYVEAWSRFTAGTPAREPTGSTLALGPSYRTPLRARVLPAAEVGDAPSGRDWLQAIDLDGDGRADLALYNFQTCGAHASFDDSAICLESWTRAGEAWRRLERAEFPRCD